MPDPDPSREILVSQEKSISINSPWWTRVRWWAWVGMALICTVYVWAGLIPMYYLNRIQVPPFEQLQLSEGKVFFKHIRGKRGGYQIGLEMPDGRKELFTCSVGFGISPGCVLMDKVDEFTGKPGRLWWNYMQDNINHYRRYVMQVEIAGVVELSNEKGQWYLGHSLDKAKTRFGFMSFIYAFLIYVILWKGIRRNG